MARRSLPLAALITGAIALVAIGCGPRVGSPSPSIPAVLLATAPPAAGATPAGSSTPPATASPATPAPAATTSPATVTPGSSGADAPSGIAFEVVTAGLEAPTDIAYRAAAPGDLFVVEQAGRIRIVRDGALLERPFLDIAGQVTAGGEQGLLGLAFDPVGEGRRFFVYYTALDGSQVLASYETSRPDPDLADPTSERVLLRMPDRFPNHNGGGLAFGPDGFLYVSTGDGGSAGDPLGSGRDLGSLLAKVLRLDVSGKGDYAIPPGGPFADDPGVLPEIWLTGLRNPWRIRFDRATGDLWIGDVGQNAWEEIDVARSGASGLDYGWNLMEGTRCYPPGATTGCAAGGLTLPVTEYGHDQGCSVTGGTVYRGSAVPALVGWYVFADYCSGRVFAVPAKEDRTDPRPLMDSGRSISAIAEDAAGELYATDLASGELLRFVGGG